MIWLYLDDERGLPLNRDILVTDYLSMIRLIDVFNRENVKFAIDFDYDLEDDYYNGAQIARFITNRGINMEGFAIHSANTAGAEQIRNILVNNGYMELED